jgi:predicted transcriptional regulator
MNQGIGPLFDICARNHGGNEQSVEANKKAHKHSVRLMILGMLDPRSLASKDGRTCDEIEDITGLPHQSCSARISELKRDGLIKKVGTRPTRSGCQAAVYQAV